MKWMSLNDIREQYLSFFESKNHLRLESFPLIPQNDKSLLLINSGMAPMKKYFTGELTPPAPRVTTCQKCIRTPDIENVGKTSRHGTFFEMLGNFSFGDYFKHEAIAWAWEFVTKVLEIPKDRLWVSIYLDDDEAFKIWTQEQHVPAERIVRLGKEDNFWEHGAGPCGPCSEIHIDRGERYGCGKPDCGVGCDCDRFMEFWNLVFTQFDSDGAGNYTPLARPNIDTGMGLERLSVIMQNVDNLFEVDTIGKIMAHVSRIVNVGYKQNAKADVSLRVITDHIRSTVFMLADGVMPSNEGRGYVLRRLLRRAARHGRLLGIERPFLYEVADTVLRENRAAYSDMLEKHDFIAKIIRVEEEQFGRTIDQGLVLLDGLMGAAKGGAISGADAFRLYDTYGFPMDLTRDIAEENGLTVDEEGFTALMKEQRARARAARKDAGADAWKGGQSLTESLSATRFVGYDTLSADAKILGMIRDEEWAETLSEGDECLLILDTSPFYAESGGQVGDTGDIRLNDNIFEVSGTHKSASGVYLHWGNLAKGEMRTGDAVRANVDAPRRAAIRRNHTSAHLLQAALREVLGPHVRQAGQLVNERRCRFDFTHFSAVTPEELSRIERLVNGWILDGLPVATEELSIADAQKTGAIALFGEKYGDTVRVVKSGGVSAEFCGGTHVDNTAKIGLFRVESEGSVAAGVRRIEAATGLNVLDVLDSQRDLIHQTAAALGCGSPDDLARRAQQLVYDAREKDREIERLGARLAAGRVDELLAGTREIGPYLVLAEELESMEPDALRAFADKARDKCGNLVAVFALKNAEKGTVTFAAVCGAQAVKSGAHAGNLVREVAKLAGGSGGGKPDFAMAGGKSPELAVKALAAAPGLVKVLFPQGERL